MFLYVYFCLLQCDFLTIQHRLEVLRFFCGGDERLSGCKHKKDCQQNLYGSIKWKLRLPFIVL